MDGMKWTVECYDTRPCFLKIPRPSGINGCPLLTETYENGKCPFAKARREDIAYSTLMERERRRKERGAAGI